MMIKYLLPFLSCLTLVFAAPIDEAMDYFWAGEYNKAILKLKPLADGGNKEAAYRLGNIYEYGHGVSVDYHLAHHYYSIAANKGDLNAMYLLAMHYFRGVSSEDGGVSSMLYWLKRAAKGGNDKAAYTLGYFYEKGIGVKRNSYWANYWYKKAKE